MPAPPQRKHWLRTLWQAAIENIGLKIVSVIIAIILFGQVRGAPKIVQRVLDVALSVNLPPTSTHKVLLTDLPTTIRVTVKGNKDLVHPLKSYDIGPLTLDLSDVKPSILIEPSELQVPAGVEVVNIQPSNLQLKWDEVIQRDLPVRSEVLREHMIAGTRLSGPPIVRPNTVRVVGGREVVGLLQVVATDPLDLSNLPPGSYSKELSLIKPGFNVDWIPGTPKNATVTFVLELEIVERRIDHIPIAVLGFEGATVRPPEVSVVIKGTPDAVKSIRADQLVPKVDLTNAEEAIRAGARFPISSGQVPDVVTLVRMDPTEVIAIAPPAPLFPIPFINPPRAER